MWESFGGWFNQDPLWLKKYYDEKRSIVDLTGLSESQLDAVIAAFVEKDILRM